MTLEQLHITKEHVETLEKFIKNYEEGRIHISVCWRYDNHDNLKRLPKGIFPRDMQYVRAQVIIKAKEGVQKGRNILEQHNITES